MKKIFTFLTLLCIISLGFVSKINAQVVTGTIGAGATSAGNMPINTCYDYNYTQQIYTAAQLTAAIGTNQIITKIRYFVTDTQNTVQGDYKSWTVYMGNTTQTNFASNTNWIPVGGLTNVFSGDIPTITNGTWMELNLATPFIWDGTSNIVIAIDENTLGWDCTVQWGTFASGTNAGIYFRADTNNPNPASPPTATGRSGVIPRLQLDAAPLQPCTTAPPQGITVSNVTNTSATVSWLPTIGATYTVRYRVSPTGAWTTINNATFPLIIPGLSELTTYDLQIATTCGGTTGAFSPSTTFTTPSIPYCNAGSTSTTVTGYISNVVVEPGGSIVMANPSSFTNYSNFTTDPTKTITMIKNPALPNRITVSKFWPGTTSSMGVGVWIDWNRNGTFETGERVLTGASNTTANVVSPNFTVPATAYAGTLPIRMRVVLQSGGATSACGTFTNGEVEDYHILLKDLPACTTAAPTLTVNNMSPTSATVSWPASTNAVYTVRYRQQGTTAWLPTNPNGITLAAGVNSYVMTPLTENTTYEVQVQTICNGTTGAFSPSKVFTTPPLAYCSANSQAATDGFISNVTVTPNTFAAMSNTSVAGTYTLYTTAATQINLFAGSTGNNISVAKSWPGTSNAAGVGVWIDFNRDGDFTDSGEQILTSSSNVNTPIIASFDVPAGAYVGPLKTTMRVIMKQGGTPGPCDVFGLGEVEDYQVTIKPCSTTTPINVNTSAITHNSATVSWTAAANNLSYVVEYSVQGSGVWVPSPVLLTTTYNLTGLDPATVYEVRVKAVCGTNNGTYTTPVVFTTNCDPAPPFVSVSQITTTTALVSWNPTLNANFVLQYRKVGAVMWEPQAAPGHIPVNGTSYLLTGLAPFTKYEVKVANVCVSAPTVINPYSTPAVFTTVRTCDMPVPGLTITYMTTTTAQVQWEGLPSASSYVVRYRKVGFPSWTEVPSNTNNITLTGLIEDTKYEMQVLNVCGGVRGSWSDPYYFTTPTIIYCQMTAGSAANEYISGVLVRNSAGAELMKNEDGNVATTYSNYTTNSDLIVNLVQGSTGNQLTVTKKWAGTQENAGLAAWIDFNRDGIFQPTERIMASEPSKNSPITATFNVPSDAFVSMTDYKYVVMRVALSRNEIPVNCVSMANGEVEDYLVRITKTPIATGLNPDEVSIYPNPANNQLFVDNMETGTKYKIYNSAGQLIVDGKKWKEENKGGKLRRYIDLGEYGLIKGVYVIDLQDSKNNVQKKFIKN